MENELYQDLSAIVDFFCNPAQDAAMLKVAGITNEKNLLPMIRCIGRSQTLTVTALARLIDRDHSATSRQVQRFERLGYVKRCGDPNDARIQHISLTPAGADLYRHLVAARQDAMHRVLGNLSPDDRASLQAGVRLAAGVLRRAEADRPGE